MTAALASVRALLFDLDGVVTPTAEVHMRAWAHLFNGYLTSRGLPADYTDDDYYRYVDGRPRYDGVRAFLLSRGITLPEGTVTDSPDTETVCGLGNRKNDAFTSELEANGIAPYPGSAVFLDAAIAAGYRVAVVSSSRNAVPVLVAAGVRDRFPVVIDGLVAARDHLAGKPAPDTFVEAARELGVPVAECAVLEDAVSGVAAGRAGAFGVVVGVDRGAGADSLLQNGADIVVDDLADLTTALAPRD